MNKLIGLDYINKRFLELGSHPDFSNLAYLNVLRVMSMSTEELENLNIPIGEK